MTADFKPALGAVHACAIPPAIGSEEPGADDVLNLTFVACRPTAPGVECELWTNLPSEDASSWNGANWREVAFVDRSTATSAPPPDEAVEWPLLSLSDGESAPLIAPTPVRHATLRIPLGELSDSRQFEYTYRLRHPDGGIEWLGDGGSNGKLEISVGSGGAAAAATTTTASGGRWKALASKAFVNGAASALSKASREWSGGEGRLGVSVGPGAEWAGFGVGWADGLPVAQTLPASHGSSLPVVILHTVEANVPTFQVMTSLVDPNTPHIIAATVGGISCKDDPSAEPSFFDFGESQKGLVLKAGPAAGPSAVMTPLAAAQGTLIGKSSETLTPLWTSSTSLAALYHPSRLIVYSSSAASTAYPAALRAPPSLTGPMAVISARTEDVVLVEPGKGLLLDLPKQQDVVLESLDVAHLRQVMDADGKPTDILFGPLKAASTAPAEEAEVGRATVPIAGSAHSVDQAPTVIDSDAESDDDSQSEEADDTMVAPAEPSSAEGKDYEGATAAKASPGQAQTLLGRLFALVFKVWSSVLGVFGIHLSVADASGAGLDITDEPELTERTPLLPPAKATRDSKAPVSDSRPSVADSPTEPTTITRFFTRIYFSRLPAQAIISVPASAAFPTRLRFSARPLASQGDPEETHDLVYKAGRVEELAQHSNGRERRFWRVELGEASEMTPAGEWEIQAWVASA